MALTQVTTDIISMSEAYTLITGATGTVEHDYAESGVFFHSSISANFTANFTNVPAVDSADGNAVSVVLILEQGATAYLPTAVQIAGSAQTIKWADAEQPALGNANQFDVVSFTLIRRDGTWYVLATLTTFG